MLILPNVAANYKPVPQKTGFLKNCNFFLNEAGIVLVSGKVCAKTLPSTAPMVVHALEFGGASASQDHKNIVNECTWHDIHEKMSLKSALRPIQIARDIICRIFFDDSCQENNVFG